MTEYIVTRSKRSFKDFSRDEWVCCSFEFLEARRGLGGAAAHECLVGYIDKPKPFTPVFVLPGKILEGETLFCWFVFPGEGRSARVVNKVLDGTYLDAQSGELYEHPAEWALILGTVSRLGSEPLLSLEMLRGL